MSQSHFTLSFPLQTPSNTKALTDQLSPMMPALFEAEDAIGTVHYSRFTVLSERISRPAPSCGASSHSPVSDRPGSTRLLPVFS
jgi:hypothetical protein